MITSPRFFWSGIILGFIGCLFYANFREAQILFDSIPLFHLFTFVAQPILLPNALSEWIPSFLHIIGMSFFTAGILGVNKSNYWKIPVTWLVIDLIFEGLQFYQTDNVLTWGNFEWVDVAAMLVSTLITIFILKKTLHQKNEPKNSSAKVSSLGKPLVTVTAFGFGAFMMLGSYQVPTSVDTRLDCEFPNGEISEECSVEPIYLSWEKIRESGKLLSKEYGDDYQQSLKNANKIYIYLDLLLINEERTGVHIFNNSNPEIPEYLDFISLIGNQDMAIRNQYLYLDSFTDLVVYDLTNINEAPVRKQNVFNFPDPTASLPDNIYFNEFPKASEGVVIGYINKNGDKFYFWSDFSGLEE